MVFSHNLLTLWTIRNLEMLAIFASNQGRHKFDENYKRAVVKKTESKSRLVHTKKLGKNSSTPLFHLNMMYIVVANSGEEINNELNRKHEKLVRYKET